jgi:hypothetical protein
MYLSLTPESAAKGKLHPSPNRLEDKAKEQEHVQLIR